MFYTNLFNTKTKYKNKYNKNKNKNYKKLKIIMTVKQKTKNMEIIPQHYYKYLLIKKQNAQLGSNTKINDSITETLRLIKKRSTINEVFYCI